MLYCIYACSILRMSHVVRVCMYVCVCAYIDFCAFHVLHVDVFVCYLVPRCRVSFRASPTTLCPDFLVHTVQNVTMYFKSTI